MSKQEAKEKARRLRREQTEAEHILWARLRGRGLQGKKFRRQQPIGNYIVDFFCPESKLVIELDGGQHASQVVEIDRKRTAFLIRSGYRVLRFWNNEVLRDTDAVLESIEQALKESPHPHPLPRGARGKTRDSSPSAQSDRKQS